MNQANLKKVSCLISLFNEEYLLSQCKVKIPCKYKKNNYNYDSFSLIQQNSKRPYSSLLSAPLNLKPNCNEIHTQPSSYLLTKNKYSSPSHSLNINNSLGHSIKFNSYSNPLRSLCALPQLQTESTDYFEDCEINDFNNQEITSENKATEIFINNTDNYKNENKTKNKNVKENVNLKGNGNSNVKGNANANSKPKAKENTTIKGNVKTNKNIKANKNSNVKNNKKEIKKENKAKKENKNKNSIKNENKNKNDPKKENNKNNNKPKFDEEEEDELNMLLYSKDNFFVREWKELKSFLWHLVFGSQILVHEAQQSLELKRKRIDNIPLTRRESLLIRKSFHDQIFVLPFFLCLATEPYYLLLISAVFPSFVPTVYVTPHIMKKNLEKNKKRRKSIAKSAAKLAPYVPFDVNVLKNEESLYKLKKSDFKQFDVDSLSWWHLKSCAGYLGLFGMLPKTVLKIRIDEYMDYIKSDDEFIIEEGLDSLTLEELRLANEQRGFNSLGLTKKQLLSNLYHWLSFYCNDENKEIPRIVMILSHIYSDNIKFQAENELRKILKKQKRKESFRKFFTFKKSPKKLEKTC